MRSALPTQIGGSSSEPPLTPDHAVVLQKGHGFTTVASGIEEAVYQAVYTREAARVQTAAMSVQFANGGFAVEGKVDVEGGGKIKSGKASPSGGDIKVLSDKECHDAWESLSGTIARPWALWCREVEVNPLYRNECPEGED